MEWPDGDGLRREDDQFGVLSVEPRRVAVHLDTRHLHTGEVEMEPAQLGVWRLP